MAGPLASEQQNIVANQLIAFSDYIPTGDLSNKRPGWCFLLDVVSQSLFLFPVLSYSHQTHVLQQRRLLQDLLQ